MRNRHVRMAASCLLIGAALSACRTDPFAGILPPPSGGPAPAAGPLERGFRLVDEPVLEAGPPGGWDSGLIDPGAVVVHDGRFHMFYNGVPYFPAELRVGYAASDDGIAWARVEADPILTPRDLGWSPSMGNLRSNSALVDGDTWVMYFSASYSIANFVGLVGRASAPSPAGPWTVDPAPVLRPGDAGAWDAGIIGNVEVLRVERGYLMYYASGGRIGLATSPDGVVWVKYDDPQTDEAPYAESDPLPSPAEAEDPNVVRTAWGFAMVHLGRDGLHYTASPDGVHWSEPPGGPIVSLPGRTIWYSSLVLHDDTAYLYFEVGEETGVTTTSRPYLATWEEADWLADDPAK